MKIAQNIMPSAVALMLLFGGCTVLAPQKDETRFFVLMPVQDSSLANPTTHSASQGLRLGLGPVTIPPYLNRPEVVTRLSSSELRVSDTDRWSERLDTNIERVLATDLADQLGTKEILTYPWRLGAPIDYSVAVAFQRFERTPDSHVVIEAKWTIRTGKDHRIVRSDSASIKEPSGTDNASAAQALSRGLSQISRDIAQEIATRSASLSKLIAMMDEP